MALKLEEVVGGVGGARGTVAELEAALRGGGGRGLGRPVVSVRQPMPGVKPACLCLCGLLWCITSLRAVLCGRLTSVPLVPLLPW